MRLPLVLCALGLMTTVLLAATPAQAACNLDVLSGRGVVAAGCDEGVASGWAAVFYDCWWVGGGERVLGFGTGAYGLGC